MEKVISLYGWGYGLDSEIVVGEAVVEELKNFYRWDEEKVLSYIESDVIELLEEMEDEDETTLTDKLVFATEDYWDASSYDSRSYRVDIKIGSDVKAYVKK